MHFYVKADPFGQRPADFYHGEVLKAFNFLYFSHSDHHEVLLELLSDKRQRHAVFDLAAALSAQLQYRGMLNLEVFAEQALRYFKLGLQARGYSLATVDEIRDDSDEYDKTVVLVTGCQNTKVRNARVEGAYKAICSLNSPIVRVVFSGAHPSVTKEKEHKVRSEAYPIEPDEASAMKVRFCELMETEAEPLSSKVLFTKESESTRTQENIEHFLKQAQFSCSDRNHLLVSSSAFHLPRIADELEDFVARSHVPINKITLIQSEHLSSMGEHSETLEHQIYVKQMAYELYRMFLEYSEGRFERLFHRETSLKV